MMKSIWTKLLLILIIYTVMSPGDALPQNVWTKVYHLLEVDILNSGQITADGEYIITGELGEWWGNHYNHGSWLIKVDSYGDTSWSKIYDNQDFQAGLKVYSVQQTIDGGYIFTGSYDPDWFGEGASLIWLVKTDSIGDTSWTQIYAGETGYSVQQTSDQGYIVAGTGYGDIVLIKTDSCGDSSWTSRYGGSGAEAPCSVIQVGNEGYIIAGQTSSYGSGALDVWLVKTDTTGNMVWSKTYGGTGDDAANSLQQTSDGGYIIAGETSSYGMGGKDVWLLKTDSSGDTVWSKIYGGAEDDVANSVQQTMDEGYIITGETYSFGTGFDCDKSNVWLLKTGSNGDSSWTRTYSTIKSDYGMGVYNHSGRSVQQTADGGYFIAGRRGYAHIMSVECSIYLLKTDELGNPTAIENNSHNNVPETYQLLQNYPNPFNPETKISYSIPQPGFVTLTVFDLQGRKIDTLVRQYQKAGKYDVPFNATDLSSGVYFYQLKAGSGFIRTGKMVFLK